MKNCSESALGSKTSSRGVEDESAKPVGGSVGYAGFVGLDVHKETIAVAIALPDRSAPRFDGEIANTPKAVEKLFKQLAGDGEIYLWCYEAGPCG